MGILDSDYDPWTGKKIKRKKGNENQGILGGIKPIEVPSIWGNNKKTKNGSTGISLFGNNNQQMRDEKRSLSTRKKKILFSAANPPYSCQNPYCKNYKKRIDDPEAGHAKAWSRGGPTTLKNSICLCHSCNRMQGTKTWGEFMQEQKDARVHNG